MPRHDRPLGGTHVEHIGEEIAGQQPVAPAAPDVQRAGVGYHFRPSAVAAMRSPVRVRSGCTDSISRTSGATRLARPPVAMTCGVWPLAHSASRRRTIPSTPSPFPTSTPDRTAPSARRPLVREGGWRSVAGSSPLPPLSAWDRLGFGARYDVAAAAHSSGVRDGAVVRRQWAWRLSPRNSPTFVSVLLMLMARSMGQTYRAGEDGRRRKRMVEEAVASLSPLSATACNDPIQHPGLSTLA